MTMPPLPLTGTRAPTSPSTALVDGLHIVEGGGTEAVPGSKGVAGASSSVKIPFKNVSSSRIETARDCLRKWWFQKVACLKEPRRHVFVVGDRLHEAGERFHRREELFPQGCDEDLGIDSKSGLDEKAWLREVVSLAIAQGVWQQRDGIQVEFPICFLVGQEHMRNGMPMACRADVETIDIDGEPTRVVSAPKSLLDGEPLPPGWDRLPYFTGFLDIYQLMVGSMPPEIWDHKTAKNRRYGKKVKDIAKAVQLLSYACLPLGQYPWLDAVMAGYNVFIKDPEEKKKKVYEVSDYISRQAAEEHWQRTITDVEVMVANAQAAPRVGDRKNPERAANYRHVCGSLDSKACQKFGGCPYRDLCYDRCDHIQMARRFDSGQVFQSTNHGHRSKPDPMPFGKSK